jgi:hypothetical protein
MNFDKPKKTKRSGTDRRWTLLFIGDHGNVITLKRFKAIVLVSASIFFIALGALAVLIFLNAGTHQKIQELKNRNQDSQKQIETLRHEKEILMARLVLSESKIKENISKRQKDQTPKNTSDQIKKEFRSASKIETPKKDKKKPSVTETAQPSVTDVEVHDVEPVLSVAVEDFIVSHESDSTNLNAQFKLKNTSPQPQKVVGHAVVVLKGNDLPENKWLVMPAVGLVEDKPSGKKGKRFAIRRFRTMNFTSKTPKHSDEFQTAAVYVYLKSGELLLEQDFPVKLPPLPVFNAPEPSVKTPAAQTPSTDKTSAETSSAETPSDETASSEDAAELF